MRFVTAQMAIGASLPVNDLRRSWLVRSPEVRDAVARVIESGWYVHGTEHAAFESELAEFLDVRHVAGVASGTDALALAMLAVGCRTGSEIVTAANAGGYASGAAAQIGAGIVYADVDPQTLLATRQTLERVIGPATNAVVVTHLYGNVADVGSIVDLCRPKGIAVIEDCAQVIGGMDSTGRRAGSLGDVATFSFYPTKNLGAAGDGGAVATNDDAIDSRVRSLRQYGWSAKYRIAERSGRNSRLDEMQAAVLRVGLPHVDGFNQRRRAIAGRYAEACNGIDLRAVTGVGCETVAHLAVVRTRNRDGLRAHLRQQRIDTDIHYPVPDHRQPGLESPIRATDLRVCESAAEEVVTLPCFPEMTDEEVAHVAAAIAAFGESDR